MWRTSAPGRSRGGQTEIGHLWAPVVSDGGSIIANTPLDKGSVEQNAAKWDKLYTKAPGKKAELASPYILRRGGTVLDAARHMHEDFAEQLEFARLYRIAGSHDGLMVERNHLLEDQDILESLF